MRYSIFLACCISIFAWAVDAPTLPKEKIDQAIVTEILKGRANTACRTELSEAKAKYQEALEKLKRRKAVRNLFTAWKNFFSSANEDSENAPTPAELDQLEKAMRTERTAYLAKIEECGDCRSKPLEHISIRDANAGRTQNWYISDVSCQLDGKPDELKTSFNNAVNFLNTPDRYAKNRNGFWNVYDFFTVDPQTGQRTNTPDLSSANPFYAFIAVRNHPSMNTAFSYLMKGEVAENSGGHYFLPFSKAEVKGFFQPTIKTFTAGGTESTVIQNFPVKLLNVIGMWYVDENGYRRYFTAGDFSLEVGGLEAIARRVHLETVVDLVELTSK